MISLGHQAMGMIPARYYPRKHTVTIKIISARSLLFGLALATAGSSYAQDAVPGLGDLVGARGASGERALEQRGYNWIRTRKSTDSSYSYWQESENGQCVEVRTTNGRYASIAYAPASDCQEQNTGNEAGGSAEPMTTTKRVYFDTGSKGAELTGELTPGSSIRYVLGAEKLQDLYVRVAPRGDELSYQIFNPDGSFLLDQMTSAKEYRGQLWQSGDHVVEVINRGQTPTGYNVIFGID
jgi:hypothetical protein